MFLVLRLHPARFVQLFVEVNALNELIPMLSLKEVRLAAAEDFWGTDVLYVSLMHPCRLEPVC